MTNSEEPFQVDWENLDDHLAPLKERLEKAQSNGSSVTLTLSLREVVALRVALESASQLPLYVEWHQQQREKLQEVERARLIVERGEEKSSNSRKLKAVASLGWKRRPKPERDLSMAMDYWQLTNPDPDFNWMTLIDEGLLAAGAPASEFALKVPDLPLSPSKALTLVANYYDLKEHTCWDCLNTVKKEASALGRKKLASMALAPKPIRKAPS